MAVLFHLKYKNFLKGNIMASITPTVIRSDDSTNATYTPTIRTDLAYSNTSAFGNFLRPFAASSLWNAKPVNPTFTDIGIPINEYYPLIAAGKFSTGVFEALTTDKPLTVYKDPTLGYIRDTDAEENKGSVTIPRWPTSAVPATGGDGHCDVVDTVTGIVHSFWQLKKQTNGTWTAASYNWTYINGSGWGDPAHYFQGARAAAVPPIGGLIRKHEVNDGKAMYNHVLAMSLAFNGLSPDPAYVYPATSADSGAAYLNSGKIPEGGLVMLAPSFDINILKNAELKKVANTLKTYGAYVVDQNIGTPFAMYVENGAGYDLYKNGWDQTVADELQKIRAAMKLVNATNFIGGDGKTIVRDTNPNLMSMRGIWTVVTGTAATKPVYDTWKQALVFQATDNIVEVVDGNNRGITKVSWARLKAGDKLKFTSITTGGGKLGVQIWVNDKCVANTKYYSDKEVCEVDMVSGMWFVFYARSAGGGVPATVSATLTKR